MRALLAALPALAASAALAQAPAISDPQHYTENRGWNDAGLGPTHQAIIAVSVTPSGFPTLVFAEKDGKREPLTHFPQPGAPDIYVLWQRYAPAVAGAWRITAERGDAKANRQAPPLKNPQQLPLAKDVRVSGKGLRPTLHWSFPELQGVDAERIRVGVRGNPRVHGRFMSQLYVSGDLPPTATSFTFPAGVLAAGERYVFQVMLEDLEDGELENRSLSFAAPYAALQSSDARDLVIASAGGLPILLTVPHGGMKPVPDVPPRTRGVTSTDGYTIELAQAVAQHLETSLGARPYLVAARFNRKYIDANRAPAEAYESPQAKAAYDAYHGAIQRYIAEIKAKHPQGALLLDIHGQSDDPAVLHRGTQNGATAGALLRKRGPDALTGPKSIFGAIQNKGYKVFPPNGPVGVPPEDKRFSGGYTVQTYGSRHPAGIDAIQIEPGRDLRKDPRFSATLGEALAAFHDAYLR